MKITSHSITELAGLVERLAGQLDYLGQRSFVPEQNGTDPSDTMVGDRPLGSLLSEFWPGAGNWSGPEVSQAGLTGLEASCRRVCLELAEEIALRVRLGRETVGRIKSKRRESSLKRRRTSLELTQARAEVGRLKAELELFKTQALHRRAAAQKLDRWLQGVSPKGLSFRDAQGRRVSQEALARAHDDMADLKRALKADERHLGALSGSIDVARRLRNKAEADLAATQAGSLKTEAELKEQLRLLKEESHGLKKFRQDFASSRQDLKKAQDLRESYSQMLHLASRLLAPFLAQTRSPALMDPAPALEKATDMAKTEAGRGVRLDELLVRQAGRLKKEAAGAAELTKRVRRINREIGLMEDELTGLMEPLAAFASLNPGARAPLTARVAVFLGRVDELARRARQTKIELEEVRAVFKTGLERGRRWQTDWREAGKSERAHLTQAQALVEEVRLSERQAREKADGLVDSLAPLVGAMGPLRPLDLMPSLAAASVRVNDLTQKAHQLDDLAQKLAAGVNRPFAANLAKPPAAFKPFSDVLRRLANKQVELGRLDALVTAANRARDLTEGPVVKAIRQPMEEVAVKLTGSLAMIASERVRLVRGRRRSAERLSSMRRDLATEKKRGFFAKAHLEKVRHRNRSQQRKIREYEARLKQAQNDRLLIRELKKSLKAATQEAHRVTERWERSQHLAQAFKKKALERHHQYRQAKYAVEWLDHWRDRALEQERLLKSTRAELDLARREYGEARTKLAAAASERDQAQQEFARERAARARQALDLLGGHTLSLELAATQSEAGRWALLAQDLALALAARGSLHEKETAELRGQVDKFSAEAAVLKKQIERISQMLALAELPSRQKPKATPVGVRVTPLTTEQIYRALDRLASMRQRLHKIGRSTLGQWTLIAAITGSLVFIPPNTSGKASRNETHLIAPRPRVEQLAHSLSLGPVFEVPSQVRTLPGPRGEGGVKLSLLPIRDSQTPLPPDVQEKLRIMADQAGLSPEVLLISARSLFAGQSAVEPSALEELTLSAHSLAKRHPLIFRELAQKGLPANAANLASLKQAPESAQNQFIDRMYQEYRTLGFSSEEALGALIANERAAFALNKTWEPPKRFRGRLRPLADVENMKLPDFLERMTPYMQSKLRAFLRCRGMTYAGDLKTYTDNLAFDMYCAAKKFQVPVTFFLAIAHQETWYANVLGDADRSASPFQIYEPTRALIRNSMAKLGFVPPPPGIRLERHLTMATYMAAFHLRELMQETYRPPNKRRPALVNMDKVLLRYNGSSRYAKRVAGRQRELARFLKNKT